MITNFCPNCYRTTVQVLADFTDGSQAMQCTACGGRYLSHVCAHHHHSLQQPSLLPIAIGAMGVVCKECKLLYQFGQEVAKYNPSAGAAIMAVALVLFGFVALDKLAGKKRR